MREDRKRKHRARISAPVSVPSTPSIVRAPEPSSVLGRIRERPDPQPTPANTGFVRKGASSSFGTALELARTFPSGVRLSR